ncbi:P-loop containing nucleoside triphosphate hydrolase protein [Mycena rosella]|uniref:P-loop containing nucleoside triphosphate hydrolase protein n=1 Tax=Mycena rosella TaxID=1033263 RepID=A0AAD7MA05_MYCRO|nr:P-loop containing nucleoside triphosphate hydrolase protein [Mycena rosella]
MSDPPFTIVQNIFKAPHSPILVTTCPWVGLDRHILQDFIDTAADGVIGVAPAYGPNCVLSVLAFASTSEVLLVRLPKRKGKAKKQKPSTQGSDLLKEFMFCAGSQKFGFHMDVFATSLFIDLGLRLRGGVDLLSVAKDPRHSREAKLKSMGGVAYLHKGSAISLFEGKVRAMEPKDVALQAWVAWRAATLVRMAAPLTKVARIDTSLFTEARLSVLAKIVRDASRLEALKPTLVRNEVADDYSIKKGQLHLTSTRFKTRVQRTRDQVVIPIQHIEVHGESGGQRTAVSGKATYIDGRAAQLTLKAALPPGPIKVFTVGREAPNSAEVQRTKIVLKALQRLSAVEYEPFFRAIWLPQEPPAWPPGLPSNRDISIEFPRPLNDSQKMAVAAILSPKPINLIHGPPGTGKTTVIAAAVMSIRASSARDRTMWLVAQSNVAVKNIAEKLASVDFLDFKLLVSKDFHYDWHEHLYEKINPNLIRSDSLVDDDLVATERQLLDSKVILCTLSMLSSSCVSLVTQLVPLQTVIVDEASQVEVGNYLPMIALYSTSLRKLVFIGDDKQCEHDLSRMPIQLGTFIGRHVYDNKLKTIHSNTAPCCHFIDVKKSKEVSKGCSWINFAEVSAAIAEARKCIARGRSYRIITPYDAQRGKLEAALQSAKLPWEDKVFCVDSFQGNEDDYIIISIVRTEKIGFLAEQRRGMRICTSRAFVEGNAKDSLVGLLAKSLGPGAWAG